MRYAQHINKIKGWKGHLWQGRFFSSPLDDAYTWSTIRYVERNPVQAGMIKKAEEYPWSSAAAHCGLKVEPFLATLPDSMEGISQEYWSEWLALSENQNMIAVIQRNIEKGLHCGNDKFIDRLEVVAKRSLRYKPQGRPFKEIKGSLPIPIIHFLLILDICQKSLLLCPGYYQYGIVGHRVLRLLSTRSLLVLRL